MLWSSVSTFSSPRPKTWQGQAFETQVGSFNSPPWSLTPCLKIRGMVDDNDRNYHSIREAVLSKCAHQCRILHCAVDASSKCVYLKCADEKDANTAYRNLHGWWWVWKSEKMFLGCLTSGFFCAGMLGIWLRWSIYVWNATCNVFLTRPLPDHLF